MYKLPEIRVILSLLVSYDGVYYNIKASLIKLSGSSTKLSLDYIYEKGNSPSKLFCMLF